MWPWPTLGTIVTRSIASYHDCHIVHDLIFDLVVTFLCGIFCTILFLQSSFTKESSNQSYSEALYVQQQRQYSTIMKTVGHTKNT